jgi:hypothetical protein
MRGTVARSIAALAIAGSALLAPGVVGAAGRGTHSSAGATTTTSATTSKPSGPWKTYYEELSAYVAARKQIAQTFRDAVGAAKQQFVTASSSASTVDERATARAAYALAIAQAAATRSAALVSLGNPPTAP